jgi:hypothetical protein
MPGSALRRTDTGQEVWPRATLTGPNPDLAALLNPAIPLEAFDLVLEASPILYVYQVLLDLFAQAGVRFGKRDYGRADARLFIFPYDWRLNLRGAAESLAAVLRALRASHGGLWPDLICHSTGGLVARYCLQSGDPNLGATSARRIIFVGTPQRGTTKALLAMDGQVDDYPGIPAGKIRELTRHPAFPGPRQLLPQPGVPMVWADDGPSSLVDLYAPSIWEQRLGQAAGSQNVMTDFAPSLQRRSLAEAGVELALCIVGCAYPTVTHMVLRGAAGAGPSFEARTALDAGDGTVPASSAYLEGHPSLNVMDEHFLLFRDPAAKAAILRFLDPSLTPPGGRAAASGAFSTVPAGRDAQRHDAAGGREP